jgi:hypothetical protein
VLVRYATTSLAMNEPLLVIARCCVIALSDPARGHHSSVQLADSHPAAIAAALTACVSTMLCDDVFVCGLHRSAVRDAGLLRERPGGVNGSWHGALARLQGAFNYRGGGVYTCWISILHSLAWLTWCEVSRWEWPGRC